MKVPQAWSPRSCSSRKYCIVNITLQPTLSQAAKDVVLAPKPVISDDTSGLEPAVLQQLLAQIGSLASVYHKPADSFVSRQRLAVARAEELQVRVKGFAFVCCVFVCAGGGGQIWLQRRFWQRLAVLCAEELQMGAASDCCESPVGLACSVTPGLVW